MNKKANFFERIVQIANHYGFTGIPELSKHIGYKSPEKLYRLDRNKDAKPSLDIIMDFSNKFDSLSLDWFITGEGGLEKSKDILRDDHSEYAVQKFIAPKVVTVDKSGNDNIVLVPEKAAAGYLSGYGDPKFINKLPTFNIPNIQHGTFRMFQVSGHSMYPTLHNGSFVVGEWVENWTSEIKDDRVYIIVSQLEGVTVKRVLNRITKYGSLYCKSDNRKEYPNFTVQPKDVVEVWEVKMHLSFELPNPAELYDRVNDLEAKLMHLEDNLRIK